MLKDEMDTSWLDDSNLSSCTSQTKRDCFFSSSHKNVSQLLSWREICPRAKNSHKRHWGEALVCRADCGAPRCNIDVKHALMSWVEAESLHHLSARYCPLVPSPRSTIAAAFSSDGKILASTHGDHTVKIVDCQTGKCIKVLSGHRRTPWVVRFHPLYSDILASGSLDHEVRLWDAQTSSCIGSRGFYRPIASIAFHAQGELLAVASGHKLHIWNYKQKGEASSPTIVLKTRRSLRAVHFHPQAAPFLLTAECPPPIIVFANRNRNNGRTNGLGSATQRLESSSHLTGRQSLDLGNHIENTIIPMDIASSSNAMEEGVASDSFLAGTEATASPIRERIETTEVQPTLGLQPTSSGVAERNDVSFDVPPSVESSVAMHNPIRQSRLGLDELPASISTNSFRRTDIQMTFRNIDRGHFHHVIPSSDPAYWELPFLQGWLIGQSHSGLCTSLPVDSALHGISMALHQTDSGLLASELPDPQNMDSTALPTASAVSLSRVSGQSGSRQRSRSRQMAGIGTGEGSLLTNFQTDETAPNGGSNSIESENHGSLAAAAAAELPCTVKLKIWLHNIQDPCGTLESDKCHLTIPNAVLCSEMGTHFSPCGRFLVACVACLVPHLEGDSGFNLQMQHGSTGLASSPTWHPIPANQIMYELRIYSLEEATFSMTLSSRAIRAAHCLTSIQFSPTSEYILLAYGRRHNSLLRNIVIDGEIVVPIYTILEVYRVSDMELVRVLSSAEDEVNVACFHPLVAGGLVYGTKEGKLRILQFDGSHFANSFHEENMTE